MPDDIQQAIRDIKIPDGANNKIVAATVFTASAFVTRAAKTAVAAGLQRVFVELTADSIDADSIQARVFANGEIISVQYRKIQLEPIINVIVKEQEERLNNLRKRQMSLQYASGAIDKQELFLDGVLGLLEKKTRPAMENIIPPVELVAGMTDYLGNSYRQFGEQRLEYQQELEPLRIEIRNLEKELRKMQYSGSRLQCGIEVLLRSNSKQTINIEASYICQNISWTPMYKVDITQNLSELRLSMFACINQKSGEDWSNISVKLSTAHPAHDTTIPQIQSWHLHPILSANIDDNDSSVMQMLEDADDNETWDVESHDDESHYAQDDVQDPLSVEYELTQTVDISSNDEQHIIGVYIDKLDADFFIHASPSIDKTALLACTVKAKQALLAGQMQCYVAGRFVGSSVLKEKAAGIPISIGLGTEPAITLKRQPLNNYYNEQHTTILEPNYSEVIRAWRIIIENNKDCAVRLHVYDHAPIADHKNIQVKEIELQPKPDVFDVDGKEGVMCWHMNILANSKSDIKLAYSIKFIKAQRPAGL
ncbi:MAG: DUF4139 domain-containing protein [Mariprofundales bacterium]